MCALSETLKVNIALTTLDLGSINHHKTSKKSKGTNELINKNTGNKAGMMGAEALGDLLKGEIELTTLNLAGIRKKE